MENGVSFLMEITSSPFWQALFITVVGLLGTNLFLKNGRLVWAPVHSHFYAIPNAEPGATGQPVHVAQFSFQNPGNAPVEDVEIVLNWKPYHYEIWEVRQVAENELPNGRISLKVGDMAPKEDFMLSLFDVKHLPEIITVRSKTAVARQWNMAPMRVFPKPVLYLVAALIIAGFFIVVYGVAIGISRIFS